MTLRVGEKTLTRVARNAERRADWLRRLRTNVAPTLNRVANIVTLAPSSLAPAKSGNRLTLVYCGDTSSLGAIGAAVSRLEKVLDCKFNDDLTADVKFKRMIVKVTVQMPQAQRLAA